MMKETIKEEQAPLVKLYSYLFVLEIEIKVLTVFVKFQACGLLSCDSVRAQPIDLSVLGSLSQCWYLAVLLVLSSWVHALGCEDVSAQMCQRSRRSAR